MKDGNFVREGLVYTPAVQRKFMTVEFGTRKMVRIFLYLYLVERNRQNDYGQSGIFF